MKNLRKGILVVILFLIAAVCAFHFEDRFRSAIRLGYEVLSEHHISFIPPGKYLHFASFEFVFFFGLFAGIMFLLLSYQNAKQRILNLFLAIVLFIVSAGVYCYVSSAIMQIECTRCEDGRRALHYHELNYDAIFFSSLFFAALPAAITTVANLKKRKTRMPDSPPF